MNPPQRTVPELISAAQRDGWHQDPLGREILAQLARQKAVPPTLLGAIAALGVALALAVALLVSAQSKVASLSAQASSALLVQEGLKAQVATLQKSYDQLRTSSEDLGKTRDEAKAEILKALNDRIDALTRENERLRSDVATARAASSKP